jgi:hypothetical protein
MLQAEAQTSFHDLSHYICYLVVFLQGVFEQNRTTRRTVQLAYHRAQTETQNLSVGFLSTAANSTILYRVTRASLCIPRDPSWESLKGKSLASLDDCRTKHLVAASEFQALANNEPLDHTPLRILSQCALHLVCLYCLICCVRRFLAKLKTYITLVVCVLHDTAVERAWYRAKNSRKVWGQFAQ